MFGLTASEIMLGFVAIANAVTAFLVWDAKRERAMMKTALIDNTAAVIETKQISEQTMKNTNHITEALVAATKTASHAEGKEEGLAIGEAKAVELAGKAT